MTLELLLSQSQSKPWIHSNNISEVCLERVRYRIVDIDLWIWSLYFSPFNFILYWCVQRTTTDSWSSSRYWLFLYLKSNDGIFEIKSTHWILVHCLMHYGPESCVVNKNNCSAISSKLRDPVKFISNGQILVTIEDLCWCPREREWLLLLVYTKKQRI